MQNEIDLKLMVAALSAVLFYENEGDVLMVSKAREKGSNWIQDQRNSGHGKKGLLHTNNKRSLLR
ncbi:MAG: hypothetical protein HOJ64_07015 [Euryarchaeota archaeon]|jgi:hypothetical protein|nr:hypothetical protein [Euryarchaeota archaeon]MBT4391694.1 hypothetical protein [Euryarchaeota archaeon]MBT4802735.1 hypothetical protein [Euryarchaeota archaeon]MBT5614609.1 hypothetical protein [Euryarchaeota archaeon]MBT6684079.1 hypothetical protein [Euryarchaeota archaeon]